MNRVILSSTIFLLLIFFKKFFFLFFCTFGQDRSIIYLCTLGMGPKWLNFVNISVKCRVIFGIIYLVTSRVERKDWNFSNICPEVHNFFYLDYIEIFFLFFENFYCAMFDFVALLYLSANLIKLNLGDQIQDMTLVKR